MLFEFLVRWKTELVIGALALFLLVSRCYSDSQVEHLQTALDDEIQARNQEVETLKSNQKKTEASLVEMYESYITRQKIIDSDYQTQNQTLEDNYKDIQDKSTEEKCMLLDEVLKGI